MIEAFLIATSLHVGVGDYNQVNTGIAIRYESAVVGVYRNSFDETSILACVSKSWVSGNWEYGLIAGGVSGYDVPWTVGDLTAFVAPFVTYRTETISPTVLVLWNAITLSFKVEL